MTPSTMPLSSQSFRRGAGRDRLLRPGAGLCAERRGDRRSPKRARSLACPKPSRAASRAPPPPSSNPPRIWACCCFIAMIVVYIILGILYESFIHPLTILSGLPSAAVGALLTLYPGGPAADALCLCRHDHADRHRQEERDHDDRLRAARQRAATVSRREQAIFEAAMIRFRPIMMTTMAAMMGTLPIALGLGTGADSRRPLGLCVAGGLAVLAAPDALHHAGDLHLHGSPGAMVCPSLASNPARRDACGIAVNGRRPR